MNICFRLATITDSEEVASIYLSSRKTFLPFAPLKHSDSEIRDWVTTQLIPSGSITIVEDSTGTIGMIGTSVSNGFSWIDHLYLAPDSVGKGIGSIVIQMAIEKLDQPIRLYIFQQNLEAQKFYIRHGFRLISSSDGKDNEEKCPDALYEYSSQNSS